MKKLLTRFSGVIALIAVPLMASSPVLSAKDAPRSAKPNVIIIYSDDHGYTDLGLFGTDSNVDTPNMDMLARNGALMTNGYYSAPKRATQPM
jgi:hypothetical protein